MRIIHGYEEGRALLERRPGFHAQTTPQVEQRLADIFGEPVSAFEAVRRIVAAVRESGDEAVRGFAQVIDGQQLGALEVPHELWSSIPEDLSMELVDALHTAAGRIRAFHTAALPQAWRDADQGYGEEFRPLERVGLYVPGGTASYPSTVLMTAIPAKVAGVREVVLCSPRLSPEVLAAAHIAGVDRLFQIGGAQAIAAMAYGTESVPQVDKICGPGNMFVALAKREVYGTVDIDGLYGPTETVVIADESADPALCASDLLAQAEHDEMASPVLLTTSAALAGRVSEQVERQLLALDRETIARAAMEGQGMAVVVETLDQALELANAFAPEHLCLLVAEPERYVGQVRYAGGIFLGERSPEVMGDYVAGPSHVMPTGGTARFASYLGVHHFLRHMPVVALNQMHLTKLGHVAAALADAEGLSAHAQAIRLRLEGGVPPLAAQPEASKTHSRDETHG
jgi:histidinol dehydrogenase